MSIKYKGFNIEKQKPTDFGRPTWVKYGKEEDIQDYIEAGRQDTEIYQVLRDYGCLKPLERTPSEIYADCTEYNDLRSTIEKGKKLRQNWDQLPTDIKNIFNNDMNEFADRGLEWAKAEMEKANKQEPASAPIEPKGDE